jgi:hypothetical protein
MTITEQPPIPQHDGHLVQPGRSSSTHPYVLTWKADHDPVYPSVEVWVAEWLAPTLEREIKRTFEWCPQWWDHPEAVCRLESLWRAWETLRLDAGIGISTWFVDHLDPQLAVLCNPDIGPFGHCHGEHRPNRDPLEATAPPEPWQLRPGPKPDASMREEDHHG